MDTATKIKNSLSAQIDAAGRNDRKTVRAIARTLWTTICEEMTPSEAHTLLAACKADPILSAAPSLQGRNLW